MDKEVLKKRTKEFTLRTLKLVDALPRSPAGRMVADQLARAGGSVGANYRAACRARSRAEFVAKLGIVVEEADESAFWLEVIMDAPLLSKRRVKPLHEEADELVAIMTRSRQTAQRNNRKS